MKPHFAGGVPIVGAPIRKGERNKGKRRVARNIELTRFEEKMKVENVHRIKHERHECP